MTYRLGTLEDLDEICIMIQKAIKEMEFHRIYQWDELYPMRANFEDDIRKSTLYVAFEDREIAAIYVISQECDEEYNKCVWKNSGETAYIIHRLCVSPDLQNRGIGQKVLRHIEEQLMEMGNESVRLDVFTENPYALRLYEKNGYEKRGYTDWRKGRFLLMEKKL